MQAYDHPGGGMMRDLSSGRSLLMPQDRSCVSNFPVHPDYPDVVLVVFTDHSRLGWTRLLKPGFRHCLAMVRLGQHWVHGEGLCDRLSFVAGCDDDLAARLMLLIRRGDRVVPIHPPAPASHPVTRLRPFTCVELCLRMTGHRAGFIVTPFALFRWLIKKSDYIPFNKNKK